MSGARRITVASALVFVAMVVGAASVLAQAGVPSASGGSSLRRTVEEGSGSVTMTSGASAAGSIELLSLRGWIIRFAAMTSNLTAAPRPVADARTLAVKQRRTWKP